MKVLLTNDDGPSSPFLGPFVNELFASRSFKELRVVVPAEEQSWIGQAVTRFRPLYPVAKNFGPVAGFLVNGTPADCAGLGIGSLYSDRPDVVISGMNVGTNAGLPFFLNSGTIGGAKQAMLLGVFSIAFSVRVPEKVFSAWRREERAILASYESDWIRLARLAAKFSEQVAKLSMKREFDIIVFDLPWEATEATPISLTQLERRTYNPLYTRRDDGGYSHHFGGFEMGSSGPPYENFDAKMSGDLTAAAAGHICVTPICYDLTLRDMKKLESLQDIF